MSDKEFRVIDFRSAARRIHPAAPIALPIPASTYIPEWERSLIALERRPSGIEKYVWTLRRILVYFGGDDGPDSVTMADITFEAVDVYIEHEAARGREASTRINDLAVIRSFSLWAKRKGLRNDDPTEGIVRPRKKIEAPSALVDEEFDQLLDAINAIPPDLTPKQHWYWIRNRRAIIIFLLTGIRLSELAALRWGDIQMRQRNLIIREGKGGDAGSVSMCDELLEELETVDPAERKAEWAVIPRAIRGMFAGQPLTDDGVAHIFDKWLPETVKIERVRAHRLRHTFASQLLYNDVDLRRIQRLMRHKNLNTTQRYWLLRDKDLDDAVNTLTLKR